MYNVYISYIMSHLVIAMWTMHYLLSIHSRHQYWYTSENWKLSSPMLKNLFFLKNHPNTKSNCFMQFVSGYLCALTRLSVARPQTLIPVFCVHKYLTPLLWLSNVVLCTVYMNTWNNINISHTHTQPPQWLFTVHICRSLSNNPLTLSKWLFIPTLGEI